MRYVFKKRCKKCNIDFYVKEVDKNTSTSLGDNPNISWEFPDMKADVAVLYSYCGPCADVLAKSAD